MILQKLPGETLKAYMTKHGVTPEFVQWIAKKLPLVLERLHKLGILHNDLHDENIVIHPSTDALWLIDFGFSYLGKSKQDQKVDRQDLDELLSAMQATLQKQQEMKQRESTASSWNRKKGYEKCREQARLFSRAIRHQQLFVCTTGDPNASIRSIQYRYEPISSSPRHKFHIEWSPHASTAQTQQGLEEVVSCLRRLLSHDWQIV
jgi:serine/threonine protein kinase